MSGPSFIDNRDGNTFAKAIGRHLKGLREAGESSEELCIATGYFTAAGRLRVAAEAERIGKVRLLIGAEPRPGTEMSPRQPGDSKEPERTKTQVQGVLNGQVRGLKTERDQGFDFHPDDLGRLKRLLEFFRSERVEVRHVQDKFFHAKAWILRGCHPGVLAGSSNLTAAASNITGAVPGTA